ncbi:uncharacterized protein LOC111709941 [Eurytemora carolleeae]|uniref:uncharacterized protein LOC111709941 n=1 Tax=Eurytemora carolleeae TaxID=1294199 RepID=UPI000C776AF0|nr:uncharacterized protein LOC111709941 [Eurytemora carolleeae]|eukprot:XP_023339690.1 uncharacterized protein LOC111709941 [Eurytemora affinis]
MVSFILTQVLLCSVAANILGSPTDRTNYETDLLFKNLISKTEHFRTIMNARDAERNPLEEFHEERNPLEGLHVERSPLEGLHVERTPLEGLYVEISPLEGLRVERNPWIGLLDFQTSQKKRSGINPDSVRKWWFQNSRLNTKREDEDKDKSNRRMMRIGRSAGFMI